jgi:hypothetical protein
MRLKDIIILQNKIDLVTESVAQNQFEAIQKFIQGTIAGQWGADLVGGRCCSCSGGGGGGAGQLLDTIVRPS